MRSNLGPTSISRAKRYLYRRVKYALLAPGVPSLPADLAGKTVLIVGSAPVSTRPVGMSDSFRVMTINASQIAARHWLTARPDVTLMQFNQIEGRNPAAVELRRVLSGQQTGLLCLLNWRHGQDRLEKGLAAFNYEYEQLLMVSRYQRIALMRHATGRLNLEIDAHSKWSNGIVATALAIHSGAARVILTGIDPGSQGHGYNDLLLPRLHAAMDADALQHFARSGHPVFTADPDVARRLKLRLWTAADL